MGQNGSFAFLDNLGRNHFYVLSFAGKLPIVSSLSVLEAFPALCLSILMSHASLHRRAPHILIRSQVKLIFATTEYMYGFHWFGHCYEEGVQSAVDKK